MAEMFQRDQVMYKRKTLASGSVPARDCNPGSPIQMNHSQPGHEEGPNAASAASGDGDIEDMWFQNLQKALKARKEESKKKDDEIESFKVQLMNERREMKQVEDKMKIEREENAKLKKREATYAAELNRLKAVNSHLQKEVDDLKKKLKSGANNRVVEDNLIKQLYNMTRARNHAKGLANLGEVEEDEDVERSILYTRSTSPDLEMPNLSICTDVTPMQVPSSVPSAYPENLTISSAMSPSTIPCETILVTPDINTLFRSSPKRNADEEANQPSKRLLTSGAPQSKANQGVNPKQQIIKPIDITSSSDQDTTTRSAASGKDQVRVRTPRNRPKIFRQSDRIGKDTSLQNAKPKLSKMGSTKKDKRANHDDFW